jgi:raffinose/stachyose/melibiose transport system permease protein
MLGLIGRVAEREDGSATRSALRITLDNVIETVSSMLTFIFVALLLLPIATLFLGSMKARTEVFSDPLALPDAFSVENFVFAWNQGGFQQYFTNSLVVVLVSLTLILVCGSLVAYALVFLDLPAENWLLLFFIGGFMVPQQVLFVPLYTLMNELGLLNTYFSLILVYVAFALPFSIFLIRQYFVGLPRSYAESARMDGCSEFQIFYRIYLPVSTPALAAVGIYQFVSLWNEFLYALTFITEDSMRTLPAALLAFQGRYSSHWPRLFAGILISVTPPLLFFIFFQKHFVRGLNVNTSKG